ncbi:(pine wood nematode) hypothetical protein [Aphelenchoides besseyi]|nr:(pine wood nematode) hypothetical protein [Aphelenchoides besseyi]KAI6221574.1 (pine wood nematode) hypothetical protein [Aphelenchoides besseyi]
MILWILGLLAIPVLLLLVYQYLYLIRRNPKGPLPLPFLGNAFSIRNEPRWEDKFVEWKKDYGPIFTFYSGLLPMVTVNDYDLIQQMFVKDGDTYADRFKFKDFNKLMRGGEFGIIGKKIKEMQFTFTLGIDGAIWREQRRFVLKTLRDFGMNKNKMQEQILDEFRTLCSKVNDELASGVEEINFHKFTSIAAGSIINNLVNGYRFTTNNKEEEFYKLRESAERMMKSFSDPLMIIAVTSKLFRRLPIIKQRLEKAVGYARDIFDFMERVIDNHIEQNDYENMQEPSDLIDAFMMEKTKLDKNEEAHHYSKLQLINVNLDLWLAGHETTSATITWGIAYMIMNPEVQEKLHEEIDREIGSDRLITVADKQKLTYLNAVIMEIQRCANIIALNQLRVTNKPVELNGVTVAKGTIVLPMIGTLMADEKIYSEPKKFNPERFIDENGKLKRSDEMMPFSVGKRQCPGENLARQELYLLIANILNHYKFTAGKQAPSLLKEHNGASMGTQPYNCRIERRFP